MWLVDSLPTALGRDALVADPAVLPLLAKVLQSHSSLSASAGEVFYHLVTASPIPPPKALLTLVAKTGHVRCVVALMGAVRSQELAKWGTVSVATAMCCEGGVCCMAL